MRRCATGVRVRDDAQPIPAHGPQRAAPECRGARGGRRRRGSSPRGCGRRPGRARGGPGGAGRTAGSPRRSRRATAPAAHAGARRRSSTATGLTCRCAARPRPARAPGRTRRPPPDGGRCQRESGPSPPAASSRRRLPEVQQQRPRLEQRGERGAGSRDGAGGLVSLGGLGTRTGLRSPDGSGSPGGLGGGVLHHGRGQGGVHDCDATEPGRGPDEPSVNPRPPHGHIFCRSAIRARDGFGPVLSRAGDDCSPAADVAGTAESQPRRCDGQDGGRGKPALGRSHCSAPGSKGTDAPDGAAQCKAPARGLGESVPHGRHHGISACGSLAVAVVIGDDRRDSAHLERRSTGCWARRRRSSRNDGLASRTRTQTDRHRSR